MRGVMRTGAVLCGVMIAAPGCPSSDAADSSSGGDAAGTDTSGGSSGSSSGGASADGSTGADAPMHPLCKTLGPLCNDDVVTEPQISDPVFIAPNPDFPSEVVSQVSHNNLDVLWHEDELFFAFRTAPTHFASTDTVMYVVRTPDLKNWSFETEIAMGTDVREPQFLAVNGHLLLYHAVLGTNSTSFDPMGTQVLQRMSPGKWGEPADVFGADFIPWRIKNYDDTIYVTGYLGGAAIYDPTAPPIQVQVLTTEDGLDWTAAFDQTTVLTGGSSESDWVFLDDGSLVAVSRNEAGDELGFGMKICSAPANALHEWSCVGDPKKYDSPLLFRHGSDIYLIGRRNVTETGWYDLMDDSVPDDKKYITYQAAYWIAPKRCSLWRVDPESLTVDFVLDLPSAGDTCFPEIVDLSETQKLVFNYTSELGQDIDPNWKNGQLAPTSIYYAVLTLPPPT